MPTLIPGNELNLNTQSIETDATPWSSLTNSTVAQSTAQASDDTHSLSITATASGNTNCIINSGTTTFPAATAGNTYQFFFKAYTTSSGITIRAGGDWYNGTTFVSSMVPPSVTLTPNTWTWVSCTAVAPATATLLRPIPGFTATGAGQVVYIDQVYFGPPTAFPDAVQVIRPQPGGNVWRRRYRRRQTPVPLPGAAPPAVSGLVQNRATTGIPRRYPARAVWDGNAVKIAASAGGGTVQFDAASSSGTPSTTSPYSWTHTPVGTPTDVVVWVTDPTGLSNHITGVTYGGVSMSLLKYQVSDSTNFGGCTAWYLASPPAGAQTVQVTWTAATDVSVAVAETFTGGGGGHGTAVSAGAGPATSASVSVSGTTTGGMIAAGSCFGNGGGTFSGTNSVTVQATKVGNNNTASDNAVCGTVPSTGGGASQTAGFSNTASDDWGLIAVEILPGAGSASPSGSTPDAEFAKLPRRYPARGLVSGSVLVKTTNLRSGQVQPQPTRQPRRYPSRALVRGYVSSTVNLLNGQVQPEATRQPRRNSARGVWRGYVSKTTNLIPGQVQPLATRLPRRTSARAVWAGYLSRTVNTVPAQPLAGQVQPRTTAGIPRRYPSRVFWRGVASRTTNLQPGQVQPSATRQPRRYPSRVVWRGLVSSTANLRPGTVQGRSTVQVPRRYPSRGLWKGYLSSTVNGAPSGPFNGQVQPRPTVGIPRRQASRAYWRGVTPRTTNLLSGNPPGGLVRRRTAARGLWGGTTVRTVNGLPGGIGSPYIPSRAVVPVPRRMSSRAFVKGYVSRTANLVSGNQPGGAVKRRTVSRGVWRGTVSRTYNITQVPAPEQLPPVPRRSTARGQWRGFVSRTANLLPPSGKPPRPNTVTQRPVLLRHRVFWAGFVSRSIQPLAVTIAGASTGAPHGKWAAGYAHDSGYSTRTPHGKWTVASAVDNGFTTGKAHGKWNAGDTHD